MLTPFSSAAVSRGNKGGSDSGLLDLYSPQVLLQALCVRLESKGKPLEQQLMKVYQSNPQLQLEKTESKIVSSPNPSPNSNSIATGIVNNNSPKSNIAANVDPSGSLLDVPPPPSTYVRSNNPPTSVNLRKSPALAATDTSTESNNGRSQSTSQSTNTNTNTPSNSWLHSSSRPQYQATLLSALESNSNKDDDDDDDDEEVHL